MQNPNICRVCGQEVSGEEYRKLFDYVNFPAHSDIETCLTNLDEEGFQSIYIHIPSLLDRVRITSTEFDDIREWLQDSMMAPAVGANAEKLRELIESVFPVARIRKPSEIMPVEVHLPHGIMEILIANELAKTDYLPEHLEQTTKDLFVDLQKGRLPITSAMYNANLPREPRGRTVFIPANLDRALKPMNTFWIRPDRAVDRILMTYARQLKVDPGLIHVAHSIMTNRLTPKGVARKTRTIHRQVTERPITCANVEGLPVNKRTAIKAVLADPTITLPRIQKTLEGIDMSRRTSLRVDTEDALKISGLATKYDMPKYKLVTALLLLA